MSKYDYLASQQIGIGDPPFYGIIMAAIRKADTWNTAKLRAAWPEVWHEMNERYNTPGGNTQAELRELRQKQWEETELAESKDGGDLRQKQWEEAESKDGPE